MDRPIENLGEFIMKNTRVFIVFTLLAITSGCAKSENKNPTQAPPVVQPTKPQSQNTIEMPKIKYPAAIIFEGGKGDPWFDENNTQHTPMWRLYICLGKTTQPTSGQVVLDLAQLGTPYERTWQKSASNEILYTERLNKVVLSYVYTTELSDDPANNYGYAYGSASVDMKSEQNWELTYLAPNEIYDRQSWSDIDFFNVQTTNGSLAQFTLAKFQLNNEPYYVSNGLARFTYSEKENRVNIIEVCEKSDKPYVLQIGSEIEPIQ